MNYFSPDYPQTLLDRIDQYAPTLNIDPSLWTEKLFSDTKIPTDVKEEIVALQKSVYVKNKEQQQPAQAISGANDQDGGAGGRRRSNKSGTAINMGGDAKPPLPMWKKFFNKKRANSVSYIFMYILVFKPFLCISKMSELY